MKRSEIRCTIKKNRVFYQARNFRESFGLCVKATIFPETHELHTAEWIEANLRLGAAKIIFYIIYVSELMMEILRDYERIGKV